MLLKGVRLLSCGHGLDLVNLTPNRKLYSANCRTTVFAGGGNTSDLIQYFNTVMEDPYGRKRSGLTSSTSSGCDVWFDWPFHIFATI